MIATPPTIFFLRQPDGEINEAGQVNDHSDQAMPAAVAMPMILKLKSCIPENSSLKYSVASAKAAISKHANMQTPCIFLEKLSMF